MWKLAVIIAAFSFLWAFNAQGYEVAGFEDEYELGKKHHTGCNTSQTLNNSAIELNFHNLSYPCYWNISVDNKINLYFFHVFLYETDELNIYKNLEDAEKRLNPLLKNPIPSQNGTITIITDETELCVYLTGNFSGYDRVLEGFYSNGDCSVPVPPDVKTLYSPVYLGNVSNPVDCIYRFNEIPHERVMQTFTFEEFNMTTSTVKIQGSTLAWEDYTNEHHPTDFFIDKFPLTITVSQAVDSNSTDHFKLKIKDVDKSCSGKKDFDRYPTPMLASPPNIFNNGSITEFECRWLVESRSSSVKLGIKFDKLNFHSVFDIVAINDGRSEISSPLLQVTTSNRNVTQSQVIRGSGSSLWISFKPLSYKSSFVANITVHEQGGYFLNAGEIGMHSTDGDDTAFLLEVKDNEVVQLNFIESLITPPATVSVYDGFDTRSVLTTLQGQIKFPILSRSNRMMVTGTGFAAKSNHFTANFKGVIPGCNHMSTSSAENYVLSENCNSSCVWIIPPQNISNSALVVYLQFVSLKEGDTVKIHKLDGSLTQLAVIEANETYVPHVLVPSNIGMLINITQTACKQKTDKVVFIGHSSYIPGCNYNIIPKASEFLQISSPLYPDTYPVFSNCHWNISASKGSIVHMSFQSLKLARNHCIKIGKNSFEGKTLPDDLFLSGDILVDFDSSGCNKSLVGGTLNSDAGFLLNITVSDCGAVLDGKDSGQFDINTSGNKTVCIWKVSVPPTSGSSVNIISYTVNEKDKLKNYEFHVYDGSSVRDSEITNNSDTQIWSRTNTLIFVYKRINASQPSGILDIKYKSVGCNMQCDNKICLHPDWLCNGKNDCGDFSDERNCESAPVTPKVEYSGYSATAFWLCMIAMLAIGSILGVTIPVCYQRYRDSRYRRFQELES